MLLLSSADFFSKLLIKKSFRDTIRVFRNTIRVSNGLDPDQDRHFVGPDLGPNCLQRSSADDKFETELKFWVPTSDSLSTHMWQHKWFGWKISELYLNLLKSWSIFVCILTLNKCYPLIRFSKHFRDNSWPTFVGSDLDPNYLPLW